MTDTELYQAVRQWRNGDKPACWQVSEWLWQRQNAAAVRFVDTLFDPSLKDSYRTQQATNIASDGFWAAMEEMDLKVSGGKLLATAIEGQSRERERDGQKVVCAVFRCKVSNRKLTEPKPLEWRGLASFAALFWRIWLLRCRDVLRSATEPRGPEDDEKELAGDLPDSEMVALARENVRAFLDALEQVTQQLREDKKLAQAAVGDTLLRYAREQLDVLSTGDHHPGAKASDAWKFVQQTLKLSQNAAYKRKSRFLQAVKGSPQSSVLLGHLKDD